VYTSLKARRLEKTENLNRKQTRLLVFHAHGEEIQHQCSPQCPLNTTGEKQTRCTETMANFHQSLKLNMNAMAQALHYIGRRRHRNETSTKQVAML